MAYQPIVTARSGKVLGFEALVRWNSPEHGAVSPAEFVPVAEETGLILDLGDWITRQAFKDARRWGGPYVSVNLSARQFLRQNVAERILRYAEEADLPPSRIQIELTETAIIDDVERAAHNLEVLRGAGMRVALDDFGTGYSSPDLPQPVRHRLHQDRQVVRRQRRARQAVGDHRRLGDQARLLARHGRGGRGRRDRQTSATC